MGKLTALERRTRLLANLDEQRHLLRKSIDDMAAGDLVEALRISAILRVLVHETGSSTPLLKQLATNYLDLKIFDERPRAKEDPEPVLSVPIQFRMSSEGVFLEPQLSGSQVLGTLGRWWERPSLVILGLGGFSRRELVLGLANKEGGAHVDLKVSTRYQGLLDFKRFQMGSGESEVTPVNLSRLMVGQAGVEMFDCLKRNFPTEFSNP